MYFKKMIGIKCYLSPIDIEDYVHLLDGLMIWKRHNICPLDPHRISLNSEKDFLQQLAKTHCYSIIDLQRDLLIGNCGLVDIDNINQQLKSAYLLGIKNI